MSDHSEKIIRVGSRKSELALIQTKHVISRLQKLYPEKKFEIHTMSTIGDRVLNVSLPKIGEKSLFTRDLEDALRNGGVDFVVHSLKDLPTALPTGMAIGAVLEREDCRDALVLNEKYKGMTLKDLPSGSVIGTSSLRRTAQLRRTHPHLEISDIRGNLNTRLAKLDAPNSKFAGIILAQAGLIRMGWENRISQILEPTDLLYAVGQGALAVECRANDEDILLMLQKLMCLQTTCKILAERSFLKTLGGGCSAPVAVSTDLLGPEENSNNGKDIRLLQLTGAVWSLNGKEEVRENIDCSLCLNGIEKTTVDEQNASADGDNDNDIEEDVSPRKKLKTDNDNNDKKQGSPKIVSDDILPSIVQGAGDATQLPDIQYLIDVHGEMFKRCPFYAMHQRDKDNGNVSTQDECPLKIPIGQDFMGKCPYVDTEQKVEITQHIGDGKCPITGQVSTSDGAIKNVESNKNSSDDVDRIQSTEVTKCPFSGHQAMNKPTAKLDDKELSHKDCPFIQKTIKLIDYDENKTEKPANNNENVPCLPDVTDELFCGLYRHKCFNFNLYEKCEGLGKKLAEILIQKGALDIMKCAQDEIREKS